MATQHDEDEGISSIDYEKLYDYLDFIDMQRIKSIDKTRYSLDEVKAELGL